MDFDPPVTNPRPQVIPVKNTDGPRGFRKYTDNVINYIMYRFAGRNIKVHDVVSRPLIARHSCDKIGDSSCFACMLEKRERPIIRHLVTAEVDAEDGATEDKPKIHVKRRSQTDAYHKRIQKKWIQRGLTQSMPVRVIEKWDFSELQFHQFRKILFNRKC